MTVILPKYCLNYNGMLPIKTEDDAKLFGFTFEYIPKTNHDDDFLFYWGDKPLQYEYGRKYFLIESGFFNEGYFIDTVGGSQFCSLNTSDGYNRVKNFKLLNRKSAHEIIFSLPPIRRSKFNAEHGNIKDTNCEVILALQNPSDRSIMSVTNKKMYYQFVEDCCKFYGKNLFVKMHPWNNGEILERFVAISEKYGCSYGKAPIDIIKKCNFVISYNSTMAIDCLLRSVPYVQYGMGTFFNAYGIIFSNHSFPTSASLVSDHHQLCDFLIHSYCYYKGMSKEKFADMINHFISSNDMFPMIDEFSYATNV